MFFVYLLLLSNNQVYTDFTSDLKLRYKDHQGGGVESTRHKRPLKLIHYEVYLLKEDAERREKFLKSSDGKRLLKQQLSSLFKSLGIKQDTK